MKKAGIVTTIRINIATSFPSGFLVYRYKGKPIIAATENPMSCLLVKLKATFVFTFFKSFGICTYESIFYSSKSLFFTK